jgi:hypothetical protein
MVRIPCKTLGREHVESGSFSRLLGEKMISEQAAQSSPICDRKIEEHDESCTWTYCGSEGILAQRSLQAL